MPGGGAPSTNDGGDDALFLSNDGFIVGLARLSSSQFAVFARQWAPQDKHMSIVVQYKLPLKDHATGELMVHPGQTIFELKQVAAKAIQASAPLKFFFRGKMLRDNQKVSECNLAADGYYLVIMEQRSTAAPRERGGGASGLKRPTRRGAKPKSSIFVGVAEALGAPGPPEIQREGVAAGEWNPDAEDEDVGGAEEGEEGEGSDEDDAVFSDDGAEEAEPSSTAAVPNSEPATKTPQSEFMELFATKLDTLQGKQESIEALSKWIIFYKQRSGEVVKVWVKKMQAASTVERQLNLLYLANQVLQTSHTKGNHYVNSFSKGLPRAMAAMAGNAKSNDKFKTKVEGLLSLWAKREVLPEVAVQKLREFFRGKESASGEAVGKAVLTGREASVALARFAVGGDDEAGAAEEAADPATRKRRRHELLQYLSKEIRMADDELERCRTRRMRCDDNEEGLVSRAEELRKAAEPPELDLSEIAKIMTESGVPMTVEQVEEMLREDPEALAGLDLPGLAGAVEAEGGALVKRPEGEEGAAAGGEDEDYDPMAVDIEGGAAPASEPAQEEDAAAQESFQADVQSQLMALLNAGT